MLSACPELLIDRSKLEMLSGFVQTGQGLQISQLGSALIWVRPWWLLLDTRVSESRPSTAQRNERRGQRRQS